MRMRGWVGSELDGPGEDLCWEQSRGCVLREGRGCLGAVYDGTAEIVS